MLKRALKFFLKLTLLLTIVIASFITAVNYDVFGHIYTKEELLDFNNETASLILSDNGTIIGKYFNENRTNVNYEQFPEHLINALVATEDARYFEHSGVDTRSLLRVLFKTILQNNKRSGGGSTITQQLAKNMYGRANFGPLTMLINKTKEGIQAYRLEQTFNKEEILTLYLNTVSFGENVFGIEAASLRYFNKNVSTLTIEESAVLVGILKANTYYNPRLYPDHALTRRNIVLEQMHKYDYLSEEVLDSISNIPLQLQYTNLATENKAGYFLAIVKKEATTILDQINKSSDKQWYLEKDGLKIKTTLDLHMQNAALLAYKKHLGNMQQKIRKQYRNSYHKKELNKVVTKQLKQLGLYDQKFKKSKQVIFSWNKHYTDSISVIDSLRLENTLLHAGLLAINPNTGAIKTWVGGIDFNSHPYDQIHAQRQLASTFKPIVYAAAIEEGRSPCEYLDNDPITLTDYEGWNPENADKSSGGKFSMTGALMGSKNIPTVNLYLETGFKPIDTLWKKMNFSASLENTPSLPLGTTTASIYELAYAYASFANGGFTVAPQSIISISTADGKVLYHHKALQKEQILEKRTTQLMNAILQKAVNEGTGTALRNQYGVKLPLAGKTGTSQNYADAWFVGYNPNLIMVSRVGAASPKIHFNNANGSGGRLALPLVARTLKKVQYKKRYQKEFPSLTEELQSELDCDDFKEKTGLENFFDLFKKKKTSFEKEQEKADRKKNKESLFKKIFKRKKNQKSE